MKVTIAMIATLLIFQTVVISSYADDAEVLPKGVFQSNISSRFSFKIDERYNEDGDVEDVATDYNTTLNGNIFPDLGLVETGFGMPAGSANVGKSVVSFEYQFALIDVTVAYGITDKLTVGILIPYWWSKNNVDARLDSSNATVGKSATGNGFGAPLTPLAGGGPFGDAIPLTTDDVQHLLGKGLDVDGDGVIDIKGFGYKKVETWSGDGVGDIEAGVKYQYMNKDNWRMAFTGAWRFPTGKKDDPDNLVDYTFGSGAHAVLFRFHNDYTGIKDLVLNATFRYDLVLPDKETLRIPDDKDKPITANKEKVERDLGDIFQADVSGTYTLAKGLSAYLRYWYEYKLEDNISGDEGFKYESLEEDSDTTEHVFQTGLSYSTVPLYLEKKFSLPLTASLSYRNRFAGSNNLLKSQYVIAGLQIYF